MIHLALNFLNGMEGDVGATHVSSGIIPRDSLFQRHVCMSFGVAAVLTRVNTHLFGPEMEHQRKRHFAQVNELSLFQWGHTARKRCMNVTCTRVNTTKES